MTENTGLLLSRAKSLEERIGGLVDVIFPEEWAANDVRFRIRSAFTEIYAEIVRNEKSDSAKES